MDLLGAYQSCYILWESLSQGAYHLSRLGVELDGNQCSSVKKIPQLDNTVWRVKVLSSIICQYKLKMRLNQLIHVPQLVSHSAYRHNSVRL